METIYIQMEVDFEGKADLDVLRASIEDALDQFINDTGVKYITHELEIRRWT